MNKTIGPGNAMVDLPKIQRAIVPHVKESPLEIAHSSARNWLCILTMSSQTFFKDHAILAATFHSIRKLPLFVETAKKPIDWTQMPDISAAAAAIFLEVTKDQPDPLTSSNKPRTTALPTEPWRRLSVAQSVRPGPPFSEGRLEGGA